MSESEGGVCSWICLSFVVVLMSVVVDEMVSS